VGWCGEGSNGEGVIGVELPHHCREILVSACITCCEDAEEKELFGVWEQEEGMCSSKTAGMYE